jgi:hypothetical protein
MAKHPERRYPTAIELAAAVQDAVTAPHLRPQAESSFWEPHLPVPKWIRLGWRHDFE